MIAITTFFEGREYKNHITVTARFLQIASIAFVLSLMASSLLLSTPAGAQVVGATLSGTLSDTSGAVIPNGQLMVKNLGTGITTTVTANGSGFYTASNLIPGSYEMTATAPGFATEVRTRITLEVGAQLVENISLKVGQATEKVEVTSAEPDVQLASSTIGAVVGGEAVVDLPLNGRSWTALAALEPGAIASTTQSLMDNLNDAGTRAYRGYGAQTSINGARPPMNNYRLDGISVNDFSNGSPANASGEVSGVDAIQEFSVLTTNYSAEYGNTSGGVINAVTRSGTNQFHGSAYDFLRNNKLDARNYFDGPKVPPFRRNQFGGSIGGPILKDRTFFFADYEGLRQLLAVTLVNVVPSMAARAGNICSAPSTPTACTPKTYTVSPAAAAYLPLYPLPNAGLLAAGNGDTGYFDFASPQTANYNFFTTRLNHNFSDKDRISGTYLIDRGPTTLTDSLDTAKVGYESNVQAYAIEETHIFSANLINSFRIGALRNYSTENNFQSALNPLETDKSLGATPGADAAILNITNIQTYTGGADAFGPGTFGFTTVQLYDDASWVRGTHTIKFGFAGEKQYLNYKALPGGVQWTFSSLSNFLQNLPTTYQATPLLTAPPEWGFRDAVLGGYVQDDWRYRPYLTLNLGLRYEMLTDPTEAHGRWAALTHLTDPVPRVGNPLYLKNPTLKDFDPRVGFAWDPFHNGKTSVRGGFGLFDALPEIYQYPREMSGEAPFQISEKASNGAKIPGPTPGTTTTVNLAGDFYNGVPSNYLTPASATVLYVPSDPSRSYVEQWNFSVQRELAPTLSATISYVGSHGVHLPFKSVDVDTILPTLTSAGWLYPAPIGSGTKINTHFGQIQSSAFIASSTYHALEARVNKRMSKGFQVEGSYTWGRSLDNSSSSISVSDFGNTLNNPVLYDPSLARGLSDFNVSQTLVVNAIWQIPAIKALHDVAGRLVNGWQLSGLYKVAGGVPFSPTFATGGNVEGSDTLAHSTPAFPDRLTGPGCHSAIHKGDPTGYINVNCFSLPTAPNMAFWTANCDHTTGIYGASKAVEPYPVCFNLRGNASRNSLIGPGYEDLDFSVFKNNQIGDKFNVQFRAEFFNIANRVNFNPPSIAAGTTDIYGNNGLPNGAAGVLTQLAGASREVQFALKLIW